MLYSWRLRSGRGTEKQERCIEGGTVGGLVVYRVIGGVRDGAVVSQVIIHVYPEDECYIATLPPRGPKPRPAARQ